ncbi:hypothetical protein [Paenibacillus puerhi]|uniref:hypothetical protein n=1 Tax=Paenibacillus puerhi TaxID=2692622 RepID=UPI00135C301A|nr:hypothetical protein [Paenibacillus puerhi]
MENVSAGLKWAIGIILTLLILAAGISIYLVSSGYLKRAQDQSASQSLSLNKAEYEIYENTSVSGKDVLEAVQRFKTTPEFTVRISTGKQKTPFIAENTSKAKACFSLDATTSSGIARGPAECTPTITYSQMINQGGDHFITETGRFTSKVYRDDNGDVHLITFDQQVK